MADDSNIYYYMVWW